MMRDLVNKGARWLPTWPGYVLGVLPFVWLFAQALGNDLGPDPAKTLERELGLIALQLLVAGLCVTPLRWIGVNVLKFRRALGLLAFFYVAMHLLSWVVLDQGLRWGEIVAELYKRPYIVIGMAGFVAMIPLAVTSTNRAIRKLGPLGWRRLHRLTYFVAGAGALHFVMLQKTWAAEALLYLAAVAVLLSARFMRSQWPAGAQPARS
ncbi:MAG: protein-methionine-sulfoxide reductase heme-binding subunit MsrQ [Paracoccaceae bacterium]